MANQGVHLISTDEMTGVQAIERIYPTQSMQMRRVERTEFEYIRHGTISLIANWDVAQGQVITPSIGPQRTEIDFATHVKKTIANDPQGDWIFIVDQLNTHKSESLVRLVASHGQLDIDLGVKGKEGVLKSMKTRAEFLSDLTHQIRFVYLPKHTSWLNQIECWFSILTGSLIRRGNFTSTDDLKHQILEFITYFNRTLAQPFVWKFEGFSASE
nr:transposase [Phormidium pseudopriestleyi]